MSRVMKKVVLAYSGGLDTSVILKWLQETYGCEVIAFCADLGQGEDLQAIKAKAQKLGVKKVYVEDLRETFVKDYVFPMLRGNADIRRLLSARDLDRAAPHCAASGRDRAQRRRRGRVAWRDRKGKRPSEVRADLHGAGAKSQDHRALA